MRRKLTLALLAFVLLGSLTAWLWLPLVVDVLPGQIRGRLPDGFLALVTTPLPTALPAPLRPADQLILASPLSATKTPAPTRTPGPDAGQTTEDAQDQPAANPERRPTATVRPRPTATATPAPTARPLPDAVRLEGLTIIPQKYNNCGPANLSIVLGYYGSDIPQLEIGEALKPNYDDRNVSPNELVSYVRDETDHEATLLYGLDLNDLQALLAAGFPVIVEKGLDLGSPHGWMGHYLTLSGYDSGERVFFGLDTFLGPWDGSGRSFEFASLDGLWAQFNRATVVVYPTERADELSQMLAFEGLNDPSMWLRAAERAQLALAANPDDAFAWFDLGASLYHLGVLDGDDGYLLQSAAAFDRAREIGLPWRTLWYQFEPYLAYIATGRFEEVLALTEAVMTTSGGRNIEETYLYRGHALLASGDQQGAERAYERALRLNPGLDAARESLEALVAASAGGDG